MTNLMKVPDNYDEIDSEQSIPDEGDHVAKVRKATQESEDIASMQFHIMHGKDAGMCVLQRYNTNHPFGLRLYKQLMQTLGIEPDNGCIDLDKALGRELVVTIAHREKDGKTYANVVEHLAEA